MKTFKDFLNKVEISLNEAVPEHLRHIPGTWNHQSKVATDTKEKMNAALGAKGFTTFEIPETSPDIDPDVAEHLTKHNWQVTDYSAGMASKKTMTTGNAAKGILPQEKIIHKKIGGILNETDAPDHVKSAFENDPARSASKSKIKYVGLVTTTPHGIAGMTSGTPWENQSCMNMDNMPTNGNSKYLPRDSEHGTHVIYKVPENDLGVKTGEPANPVSRYVLKPFHSEHGDTIFRPENREYGNGGNSFADAASRWSTEHYPAKIGVAYNKNPEVYDDTGNNKYKVKSKSEIENSVNSGDNIVDNDGDSLDKELIDHAINHFNKNKDALSDSAKKNFVKNMAKIGNLNSQHISTLHNNIKNLDDRLAIAENHGNKLSTTAINELTDKIGINNLPHKVLMNSKLPSNVIDNLDVGKYKYVRKSLLNSTHYDKLIDNYIKKLPSSAYNLSNNAGHYTKEQISKLIDTGKNHGIDVATQEPNFDKNHHESILKNSSYDISNNLVKNSKFASIDDVKNHDIDINNILQNKNLSENDHKKIKDAIVNDTSLINSGDRVNIPEHISEHFTDDDHKKIAKSHGRFTFDSSHHTMKHLDNILDNINESDNLITANKGDTETNDKLKNVSKKHIVKYLRTLYKTPLDNKDTKKYLNKLNSIKNFNAEKDDDTSGMVDMIKDKVKNN